MSKDIIRENIIIDLEEASRSAVSVSKSLFVEFPPRNFDFWGGGFLSKLAMKRTRKDVTVGVRSLQTSDSIMLAPGCTVNDLFTMLFDGEEFSMDALPQTFTVEKESTPFQFYFSPEKIVDCYQRQYLENGRDPEDHFINGKIYITNDKNEILDEQDFEITIEFKNLTPEFEAEIKGPARGSLKYDDVRNSVVKVGEVRIINPQKFQRSPMINFKGTVSVLGPDGKLMEDLPAEDGQKRQRIYIAETGTSSFKTQNVISAPVVRNGLNTYESMDWDILMDFSDILNPLTTFEKYTIVLDGYWALNYTPSILNPIKATKEFRLMKNNQGTEMRVKVDGQPAINSVRAEIPKASFIPGDSFRREIEINISNIATDNTRGGALKVMMPILNSRLESDAIMLFNARRRQIDINDIISLEGDDLEDMRERGYVIIPNADTAPRTIRLLFDPKNLYSIAPNGIFNFDTLSEIEIPYYENSNNEDWDRVERKTFKVNVHRQFEMLPFPAWLGLDYGSSAIVSIFDGKLLDLAQRRRTIFAAQKEKNMWKIQTSESESATPFISSDLLLNIIGRPAGTEPVSALCSEQPDDAPYSNLGVCLSPTLQLVNTNYERNLPCLKLLVGNQTLPENPNYEKYAYFRRDDGGEIGETTIKESRENEESNSLSQINVLFDEAYKIVFKYYLRKEIADMDRVNRLVLTYPNSYTPEHLRVLENIAKSTFANLRPGYLRFVSESDAVAAYYMEHWQDYNSASNMKLDENILVYDMGAGTLDVTYLTKTYDKTTDSYTLEIKGKLGICKAGNYLDFVLAKIVSPDLAKTTRPSGANADRMARARIALKDSVRNHLKPMLSGDPTAVYKFTDERTAEEISMDIADVLADPLLRDYLSECTDGVIQKMKNYLGGDFSVDTVILSGRSCRLKPLQQALRDAMKKVKTSRKNGIRFHDLALKGEEDRQKTAVIEGAVTYAGSYSDKESKVSIKSRRLYASFGVAYRTLGNELKYVELANHNDMPFNADMRSKKFEEKLLPDMRHVKEVTLIQSFLSEHDTFERLKANDFEYLSDMACYKLDLFSGEDTLRMAIGIDRYNHVTLYVNDNPARGEAPKGIDLGNEITRQSIWPATI